MPKSKGEVERIARLWFERHGENAVPLARDMASEMQESGNMEGADLWVRVIAEMGKLIKARL